MNDLTLNYHLMHPGGESGPGDPNVAFLLDGTYHLHYILQHPWKGKRSSQWLFNTDDWKTEHKLEADFENKNKYIHRWMKRIKPYRYE